MEVQVAVRRRVFHQGQELARSPIHWRNLMIADVSRVPRRSAQLQPLPGEGQDDDMHQERATGETKTQEDEETYRRGQRALQQTGGQQAQPATAGHTRRHTGKVLQGTTLHCTADRTTTKHSRHVHLHSHSRRATHKSLQTGTNQQLKALSALRTHGT